MELTGFTFKRDHEDWIGPIDISITNSNPCVVLTGINAGGKSLTLRAIEKFTKLLADPCEFNKKEFDVLARVAGIDEISATYEFQLENHDWGSDGLFYIEIRDPEKLLAASGAMEEKLFPDNDDMYYKIENSIETRFTKDGGFTRRYGVQFTAEFDLEDEYGEPVEWGIREQVFSEWEQVLEDSTELVKDRMFSYGFDGFEEKILQRSGIEVDAAGFGDHHFWEKEARYLFVAKKAIMLQVDEAYQVSAGTMERLRPFNENANAKRKGKTWINKRLKKAFEMSKKEFEEKAKTEYLTRKEKLEADLERIENIEPKGQAAQKVHEGNLERTKTRLLELGTLKDYLQSDRVKRKFANFLYPRRKTQYHTDDEGNLLPLLRIIDFKLEPHKVVDFDWVSNPRPPTASMSFSPAEMEEKTPDFSDDIQGIAQRLMYHCPHLLQHYDRELLFWIIVSSFIDFPDDPSPTYYSSGQRRMISIIETIMDSERGDVLLIDEPELSLHIDWQRRFIDQISIFGKRLVIATHSPDIIYNHTEKVVEVPPSKEV
jgi:hypothetical protein